MKVRDHARPAAGLLAALAVAVGLVACGSSDAGGGTAVPPASIVGTTTAPPTTLPAATTVASPPETGATTTTDNELVVSDEEVADLEKQLDEIDQLLTGVDADLSHD